MQVTLSHPHRMALRGLAIWCFRQQLPTYPLPPTFSKEGLQALADLIPRTSAPLVRRPKKGRPQGTDSVVFGLTWTVNQQKEKAFYRLADVLGCQNPQEAIRAVAEKILQASPGVEIGKESDIDMTAIGNVVAEIRAKCLEASQ